MSGSRGGRGLRVRAGGVLENVLGKEEPKDLPLAFTIVTEVVRLSDKLGLPIDSKWLGIAEGAAELYEVDMPVRDSPREAILALEDLTRGKQPTKLMGNPAHPWRREPPITFSFN